MCKTADIETWLAASLYVYTTVHVGLDVHLSSSHKECVTTFRIISPDGYCSFVVPQCKLCGT